VIVRSFHPARLVIIWYAEWLSPLSGGLIVSEDLVQHNGALDMTQCDHLLSERQEAVKTMVSANLKSVDEIIIGGLPDGFDLKKIARSRFHGSKWEVWSYDGVPFLELHDPEFSETAASLHSLKINVVTKYRYLPTSGDRKAPTP
jgi:hypothetical protein